MPYASNGAVRIFYEAVGDGPGLVFLHGAGGNGAVWWRQAPVFGARYRCLFVDHRGFGRSIMDDPAQFGADAFAGDLFAVLDHAGLKDAALVCQSMGGWTGLRAALAAPERVRALIAAGTGLGLADPGAVEELIAFATRTRGGGESIEDAALGARFRREDPAGVWLYRQLNLFNPFADRGAPPSPEFSARMASLLSPQTLLPLERAAALSMPVLVLTGEEDPIFSPASAKRLQAAIPGAALAILSGCGHSTYFEDPAAFNETVLAFLNAHGA